MAKRFKKRIRRGVKKFHRTAEKRARATSKLHVADTSKLIRSKRTIRRK